MSNAIQNERLINYSPDQIFNAFKDPNLLSQWWGPKGFSNTFEIFEFKKDGQWKFVMHGPDGKNYPNESKFRELSPNKIVIEHVVLPRYVLTITLTEQGKETLLHWHQDFENQTFAKNMKDFLTNANEQNLDRLQAVLES